MAGVDLFFVLSGFLITGILYDTLGDSQYFRRFFARRSLRIFPVYYLTFAILLALTPLAGYAWRLGHLLFLVYLGNFISIADPDYYGVHAVKHTGMAITISHFWSLCVEEQFYLLWPPVIFFLRKRNSILLVAASLCMLTIALRAYAYHTSTDFFDAWVPRTLPFRMDTLLIGGMLALLLRSKHADRIQRSCKWIFLAGSAAVMANLTLASGDSFLVTGYTFIAVACAGLIGSTLRSGGVAFRLFNIKLLRILGKYSYGFYIFHLIFRWEWIHLLVVLAKLTHSMAIAGMIALPLNFGVTFLAAKISYDFFESRFLTYKKHFEYDSEVTTHRHAFVTQ